MDSLRSFYKMCTLFRFPRFGRALSYISPSFLWYFTIFARCESVLAEQVMWLLLAFAELTMHVDRQIYIENVQNAKDGEDPDETEGAKLFYFEWTKRMDALAHLYLGVSALCVSQGVRRAYGGWMSICITLTPPPPLLWLVDLQTVRSVGLAMFTTIDLFLQSNGGSDLHGAFFVLFLHGLRLYIQPTRRRGRRHQRHVTWRAFGATLLLSKQIDDAKRWMIR